MKLPALWIVASLIAGIALAGPLGLFPAMRPAWLLALVVLALLAGLALWLLHRDASAFFVALSAWALLGALLVRLDHLVSPTNLVSTLVSVGRIDTGSPLRWRGRLREDPIRLPWGVRYVLDLEEVEVAGETIPVSGGLRLNHFLNAGAPEQPPALRAGDRVEALVRAREPRNFGNPGSFDVRGFLARENIHLTGSLRSLELLRKMAEPPPTVAHRLARTRGRLLERLDSLFADSPGRAAVLRAMLLGDRSFVDHERAEAFQKAAAYHVLVIAGLHVAALVVFVLWACRKLRIPSLASTIVTLAVLAGYVGIVEDRPPILRAALMATMVLLARLFFRRVELLNTVALAALVILVARPSALSDPSFQLSFVAVGTIGALAAPWIERSSEPYRRALAHLSDVTRDGAHAPRVSQFRRDLRAAVSWLQRRLSARLAARAASLLTLPFALGFRLWEIGLLSATIQLGMLPLLSHYFHRVSLAGPFANIPAVLLTGLIVPLGFLTLTVSLLWLAVGTAFAKLLGVLVGAMVASVEWFTRWSWTSYRIPGPPLWLVASFFGAMILLAIGARARRKRWQRFAAISLAALAAMVALYPFAPKLERSRLEVTVLDVGQGDAIFVAFPDGRTLLVDGGGTFGASRLGGMRTGLDIGEEVVSPYLWSRGLKALDVIALSHAHQDHIDGLNAVLQNFRVRELWVGHDVSRANFRSLVELAQARGVRVVHQVSGKEFSWDEVSGHVLWPDSSAPVEDAENNDSLVLRLEYGRSALLLPGDIEQPVEHELVAEGVPLAAGFLKVAHHGSKTSSSDELLGRVSPRIAAISVGENNPFGHPNAGVLERLQAAGVRVLRTDRDGAITVLSDGETLHVRCFFRPTCADSGSPP